MAVVLPSGPRSHATGACTNRLDRNLRPRSGWMVGPAGRRRALLAVLAALLREHAARPLLVTHSQQGTRPSHASLRGLKPGVDEFVGSEPLPEYRVIVVHIDCRVGYLRIIRVACRDWLLKPPAERLLSDLQHAKRHRDRHPQPRSATATEVFHFGVEPKLPIWLGAQSTVVMDGQPRCSSALAASERGADTHA